MSRMPVTSLRFIAIFGMIGVALGSGFLFLLASLTASGVLENVEPDERTWAGTLAWLAAAGGVAALACLVSLVCGWRLVCGTSGVVVSGSALAILLISQSSEHRFGRSDDDLVLALVGTLVVGLLALGAALAPPEPSA
jgi:vacuolar-type H+-ATPase subunit I/STV1